MADTVKNPCPQLSPYVAEALAALRADGIEPTDEQVGWLVLLRRKCDLPQPDAIAPMLGAPVKLFDLQWWPLHARARRWFTRAGELCGSEYKTDIYLFAHMQSAPGDRSLDLLQDAPSIIAEVGEWRTALALHDDVVADLVLFLRTLDGFDDGDVPRLPKEKAEANKHASELAGVGMLCKMFPGTEPEYWRSGISEAEIDELLRCQYAGAWATAPQRVTAIENFRRAIKWIRCAHGK
jgi:hypothetical protein